MRTEADARARAERDRVERATLRATTGKPVELVHDYAAYYIKPVPAGARQSSWPVQRQT